MAASKREGVAILGAVAVVVAALYFYRSYHARDKIEEKSGVPSRDSEKEGCGDQEEGVDIEESFDGGTSRSDCQVVSLRYKKNKKGGSGNQRIYVKTYGCQHNNSDSEVMMGLLESYGYALVDRLDSTCDLCLINSCTVKTPSEEAMKTLMRKAKEQGVKVVVAGCVPQSSLGDMDVSVIGVRQIERIVEVVEQTLQGATVKLLGQGKALPSLELPKMRFNKLIESEITNPVFAIYVVCSYTHIKWMSRSLYLLQDQTSQVKQVPPLSLHRCFFRGHLGSYQPDEILSRTESAVTVDKVQQIWLTSEDTGAYGIDIGTDIGQLLQRVVALLADLREKHGRWVMLRLGMTNPPYIAKHVESVVETLNHPNCFKFIHIPVQSGSDVVLHNMNREYTRKDFCDLVDKLLAGTKEPLTIATDIICGFPMETEAQHQETISLIQRYRFPVVNISQFYPRPDTPAAKMKRVPTKTVKQRSADVARTFHAYTCTDFLRDTTQKVWYSSIDTTRNQVVGHTTHYVKVVVPIADESLKALVGNANPIQTRILSTEKWHVVGRPLV